MVHFQITKPRPKFSIVSLAIIECLRSLQSVMFSGLANYFSCCGMAAGAQTFRQIDDILVHSLPPVVFNNFYRISNS